MPSASDHDSTTTRPVIVAPHPPHVRALDGDLLAFVAIVDTPSGKPRRRVFLSLAAALRAVERAKRRGLGATVSLAELRAVGEVSP
jgi:hypothetical protein